MKHLHVCVFTLLLVCDWTGVFVFVSLCLCVFVFMYFCLCVCGSVYLWYQFICPTVCIPPTLSGSGDAARESGCLMLVPDAADHVLLLLNHLHQQKTLLGPVQWFHTLKRGWCIRLLDQQCQHGHLSNTQPAPTSQSFTKDFLGSSLRSESVFQL